MPLLLTLALLPRPSLAQSYDPELIGSLPPDLQEAARQRALTEGRQLPRPVEKRATAAPDPDDTSSLYDEVADTAFARPEQAERTDRRARPDRKERTGVRLPEDSLERFGLRIFRQAPPTLFGSHAGAVGDSYQLGPDDELIFTQWGDHEARRMIKVDRDGQIQIEGAGLISVNGLTLRQAQDLLKSRLSRVYTGFARGTMHLDLTLGKLRQIRVFVVGEVQVPGGYVFSGNTSVLNALYQARGPSPIGSERLVTVVRGDREQQFDLYDYIFRGKRPAGDILRDGDIVRVPVHGPLVTIRGAVKRPAIYELLPTETGRDLLLYAGGAEIGAADQSMSVQRVFRNGRRDAFLLPSPSSFLDGKNPGPPIQDGDVVSVFPGTDPSSQSVTIIGSVFYPGTYPWREGMQLPELLQLAGGPTDSALTGRAMVRRTSADHRRSAMQASVSPPSEIALQPRDTIEVFNLLRMVVPDSIRVSGAVLRPGMYSYYAGMRVKDLILQAGGLVRWAERGRVRIEKALQDSMGSETRYVLLDSALTLEAADLPLEPWQHLAIPRNPNWYEPEAVVLEGYFERPGLYYLLYPGEPLTSVVNRAGGIRRGGYPDAARFIRGRDSIGRVRVFLSKALKKPGSRYDISLRGGDTLRIPDRPATVRVSGWVNMPTSVMWEEGRSWQWYIAQAGGFSDSANSKGVYVQYADGSILTREYGLHDPDPGSEIVVPKSPPKERMKTAELASIFQVIGGTIATLLTVWIAYLTYESNTSN